ncbi:transient receptor potential cation channel subfamily M member 5-like [Saccostrea cucullata]|uniref:transient receptor potential cation channel subfamily M member 5-like n=1 Tax=Saccostrea cuccullata TaxID=36930 RepID=UPI002ED16101
MVVYTVGMLLKLGDEKGFRDASKMVLVLTFILLCIRSLNTLMISEIVGTKLIMIKRMFLDTFAFLTIMTVVTGCYCVSYYAILFSDNSDLSYSEIERIIQNGFWIVFGENDLTYDNMKPPHCTTNKTLYKSGEMPRCASEWGLHLGPYIKAMYALITIVLLLNLLIAMYSEIKAKAGYDCYEGFMRRHPQLAIRKPEGLSAAREMMLSKHVVTSYFQLLGNTVNRLKLFDKGS